MRPIFFAFCGVVVIGAVTGWVLTAPDTLSETDVAGIEPDLERGEVVFFAAGCASCHTATDNETAGNEIEGEIILSGGKKFATEFGTFIAPNITSDKQHGIGEWSKQQFVNAVLKGVGPQNQHYYPAFPYASYSKMTLSDAVSLYGYLQKMTPSSTPSKISDVSFPFNIRRGLGIWKLLFASDQWVVKGALSEQQNHGRYLVEALGHCGECHTPRNLLGGLQRSLWLQGAANPNGKGKIPDISLGGLNWSENDIAEYLKSGFTPDFDTAGGEMVDVIKNTSKLTDEDRQAIASYLKIVPAPVSQ